MKIIIYSDLHLEFGSGFMPPENPDCDLVILAGDICVINNLERLDELLNNWKVPTLYVTGNHEYYTRRPMAQDEEKLKEWLSENHPHAKLLLNEDVRIGGVNFFGGTMWTDFNGADPKSMDIARSNMNDFRLIRTNDNELLKPADTIILHQEFVEKLKNWFEKPLEGPRVVISHHAPVTNPHTKYGNSNLSPAFNALDMVEIIEKYQPRLWVYGHTHECDKQNIGETLIISNQRGYPNPEGGYECNEFDEKGCQIVIETD